MTGEQEIETDETHEAIEIDKTEKDVIAIVDVSKMYVTDVTETIQEGVTNQKGRGRSGRGQSQSAPFQRAWKRQRRRRQRRQRGKVAVAPEATRKWASAQSVPPGTEQERQQRCGD